MMHGQQNISVSNLPQYTAVAQNFRIVKECRIGNNVNVSKLAEMG
jgi:hypothetical protein